MARQTVTETANIVIGPADYPMLSRRVMLGIGGSLPLTSLVGIPAAVRLDDFLDTAQRAAADRDEVVNCTDAFTRALATGRHVSISMGHYGVDALRLPSGGGLIGAGGAVLHQMTADRPAIDCVSDQTSGQLAGIVLEGIELVGHPAARTALVRLEARGAYAIWRSRFAFFARNSFRALEIEASDGNNVFECDIAVVSESTTDTAVLTRGGVYNRYHLFLTRTRGWALDDQSSGSEIRVVAENAVIFRGQANQVTARIEGIATLQAADRTAITDHGFGNTFHTAEVNMPAGDAGKLDYAFRAFQRSIFINPQIVGEGAPSHPFAPTSNFPFTVIGGRSQARHRVEATFDGSDIDHDPRNITFVGDTRDFTDRPTHPATADVQRVRPADDGVVRIAARTQIAVIDTAGPIARLVPDFGSLNPFDGWQLSITANHAVAQIDWPVGGRFASLPTRLAAGQGLRLVYNTQAGRWLAL